MSLAAPLDGRAALVTGAGGGIGSASARARGEAGAAVLLVDVDAGTAGRVAGQLSGEGITAEAYIADVTDPDAVAEKVEFCQAEFGSIAIAVNNAGIQGDPASAAGRFRARVVGPRHGSRGYTRWVASATPRRSRRW